MDKKEILIVDDRKENLEVLSEILKKEGFKVRTALSAKLALLSIKAKKPDLILLDIEMPEMNGYELASVLKLNEQTANIPIIFISAHNDVKAKVEAFKHGGVDYISKPFAAEEVIARVKTHLALYDYQRNLEKKVEEAVYEIKKLNKDLEETQNEMTLILGEILETRDDDTGRHVLRVATYAKLLAELYGLDKKNVALIYKAAPFHDAGKVAIPDSILKKPGKLTAQEWEIMKTHTTKGYEIFSKGTRPILKMSAIIAKEHHERWDGSGYPDGLKDEEINIAGRIVALVDVLDALTSKRVYKEAWSFEDASNYIVEQKGKMFEPKLVELFEKNIEKFREIYNQLKD